MISSTGEVLNVTTTIREYEAMTKGSILVTDSLFIYPEQERLIEDAGYTVIRLDKLKASEAELCEAVVGKVGYILGGVEEVTDAVIAAADQLKVIAFTGSGYFEKIPAYKAARRKGIAITVAKGGNSDAVAEFTISLCISAVRQIFSLTNPNGKPFATTRSVTDSVLGVLGYGEVGRRVATLANKIGFSVLVHARRPIHQNIPGIRFVTFNELLENSDIITLHVDKINGMKIIGEAELSRMKIGSSIVNAAFEEAVDLEAIEKKIKLGEMQYLADHPVVSSSLYPGLIVGTNSQSAFNTEQANLKVSNMATRSLLSILDTGADEFRVV
jgi:phosphoglycerate dehydrogenase-like enzyme